MKPRLFYVSIRLGPRTGRLAGPFATRSEALTWIEPARRAAVARDPWTHFAGFGTCSVRDDRPGVLNDVIGCARWLAVTT